MFIKQIIEFNRGAPASLVVPIILKLVIFMTNKDLREK